MIDIFFNGQIFDACAFVADLIRKAKDRIVVIDSYVDDSVLVQLSKRDRGATVDIYGGKISQQLRQDVARHNAQYPGVTLHAYNQAHDRFLIIDEDVYHIGHSLKNLGKKLFAFSKMEVKTGANTFCFSFLRIREWGIWLLGYIFRSSCGYLRFYCIFANGFSR